MEGGKEGRTGRAERPGGVVSELWGERYQMGRRKRYLCVHDMWEDYQMSHGGVEDRRGMGGQA